MIKMDSKTILKVSIVLNNIHDIEMDCICWESIGGKELANMEENVERLKEIHSKFVSERVLVKNEEWSLIYNLYGRVSFDTTEEFIEEMKIEENKAFFKAWEEMKAVMDDLLDNILRIE